MPGRLKVGRGPLLGKAIEFLASQGSGGVRARGSLLQAQTSAICVDLLGSGALQTQRLDVLVGGASRGACCLLPLQTPQSSRILYQIKLCACYPGEVHMLRLVNIFVLTWQPLGGTCSDCPSHVGSVNEMIDGGGRRDLRAACLSVFMNVN